MPDARAAAIHARHTRINNNMMCIFRGMQHASPELRGAAFFCASSTRARRARESAIRRYEKLEHMLGKLNA